MNDDMVFTPEGFFEVAIYIYIYILSFYHLILETKETVSAQIRWYQAMQIFHILIFHAAYFLARSPGMQLYHLLTVLQFSHNISTNP